MPPAPAASLEESVFDSVGGGLESILSTVKAIPKVIGKAAHYSYYTAKAALGLAAGVAIAGTAHALILPAGIAAGTVLANWKNEEKTTFKQIANEAAVGGLLGGLLHHVFVGANYIGKIVGKSYGTTASLVARGGCAVAQMPPFLIAHEYLNRIFISDYKPQPLNQIGKKIKSLWPIIPPLVANFTVVPDYLGRSYQMPVAAGIATTYGLIKAEKKEQSQTPPSPQQQYGGR